jgi:hypothetical protein
MPQPVDESESTRAPVAPGAGSNVKSVDRRVFFRPWSKPHVSVLRVISREPESVSSGPS